MTLAIVILSWGFLLKLAYEYRPQEQMINEFQIGMGFVELGNFYIQKYMDEHPQEFGWMRDPKVNDLVSRMLQPREEPVARIHEEPTVSLGHDYFKGA